MPDRTIPASRRVGDRPYQQDAYACEHTTGPDGPFTAAAVADGMGSGAGSGPIAQAAVSTALALTAALGPVLPDFTAAGTRELVHRRYARRDYQDNTTLVLATVLGGTVRVAWIGDSRAYALRPDGTLQQLTRDHNLAARGTPNVLTRVLLPLLHHDHQAEPGECERHQAETAVYPAADGWSATRLLLCTDGVCGPLGDEAIAEVLRRKQDPGAAAKSLTRRAVDAARAAGEKADNATALVLDL